MTFILWVSQKLSGPYAEEWLESMQTEYDSLIRNDTWKLVDLSRSKDDDRVQMGRGLCRKRVVNDLVLTITRLSLQWCVMHKNGNCFGGGT